MAFILASTGCRPDDATGSVQFAATVRQAISADVTHLSVTSSGPGIPSVSVELAKTNGVWGGTIHNLPAGPNRAFHAQAFDSAGTLLFEGQTSNVTIVANQTSLVVLTLRQVIAPPPFGNEAPVIDSVLATPLTVQPGDTVSLLATAHDSNPTDTLTYAWTSPGGSFSSPSGASTSWVAPAMEGITAITLTVADSSGAAASVSVSVNITSGGAQGSATLEVRFSASPVVENISTTKARVEVGQTTTLSAIVTPADGEPLSYQWTSSCAGTWTEENSNTARFTPSALPAGACNNCQVHLAVSDGHAGQASGTLAICVASSTPNRFPPTVIRSYQSSLTAQPSQELTFEIVGSDPQESALGFGWSANMGTLAAAQDGVTNSRIVWTAPSCAGSGAEPAITATVTNALGLTTTRSFSVTGLPACVLGWTPSGSMLSGRYRHSACQLPSGKVLVSGGIVNAGWLSAAEMYDPATGSWSSAGAMSGGPRSGYPLLPLPNGKVLAVGGHDGARGALRSVDVYDPVTNTWSPAAPMAALRAWFPAVRLPNGKVLAPGGWAGGPFREGEVYDPTTNTWSAAASMESIRYLHSLTLLPNGKVLAVGGYGDGYLASAEVYDPVTNSWSSAGSMSKARAEATATLLPSGKVLIVGGRDGVGSHATAELYDSATNTWSSAGTMASPRHVHTATLLPGGKVLIAGGNNGNSAHATAEVYDPATNTWPSAGSMSTARAEATATLLANDQVLIVGGSGAAPGTSTAELYGP
ncbi:kelch repeat-containing protein [Myxococcaceae bacterium GXIMD 01537]